MTDRRARHPEQRFTDTPMNVAAMCGGKDALTYRQAVAAVQRAKLRDKRLVAFRCGNCRQWHLGHPEPRIKRCE